MVWWIFIIPSHEAARSISTTFTDTEVNNCFMQLSMLFPRGGGEPRDEVGTLNVLGHPRWGILGNFEHKCWPRDREV